MDQRFFQLFIRVIQASYMPKRVSWQEFMDREKIKGISSGYLGRGWRP
jgi:hypothetical protein